MTVACGKVGLQEVDGRGNFARHLRKVKRAGPANRNDAIVLSILLYVACSKLARRLEASQATAKGTLTTVGAQHWRMCWALLEGTGRNACATERRLDNRLHMQYILYRLK